jgi:hypothetical protein
MDIEQLWEKAQRKTEVVRGRVKGLATFESTKVPYIFLAESSVNEGCVVVRKGKVLMEKPLILLPEDLPQFDGFDFEKEMNIGDGALQMFFLLRGIRFPSLKFNNSLDKIDLYEGSLSACAGKYKKELEKKENVNTALILGPEECWQFSLLIYMGVLAGRSAKNDILNLMDRFNPGTTK